MVPTVTHDDRLELHAAEGIDLTLPLAGVGSRGIALIIDAAIATIVLFTVGWALAAFGDVGLAGISVVGFLVGIGYPIVFEGSTGGRTPGKAAIGIRVLNADGTRVGFLPAAIRGIVRPIDMLPGMFLAGIIAILATSRAQRLGDLAASTIVVHQPMGRSRRRAEAGPHVLQRLALVPELHSEAIRWDVSAVDPEHIAIARTFLERREELAEEYRRYLANTISTRLSMQVSGVPLDGDPEAIIERVVAAKLTR